MGVFSPIVSVAAALRVNTLANGVQSTEKPVISNLPARTVNVGEDLLVPSIDPGTVKLFHAGKEVKIDDEADSYTYNEVGQYEWRFYANGVLFDTYTVMVADTTYGMTMPSNVVTVAPKDLASLNLPLPAAYKVDGETVEVAKIEKGSDNAVHNGDYVNIYAGNEIKFTLTATVALENRTFGADKIAIDQNGLVITLGEAVTGALKVSYKLYSADGKKLYSVLPLSNIEIKNVEANEVTFANVPTAPSVKNLAYYSNVALTAPTADSAKVGTTSFSVEAQTKIFKVQCSPYNTEPSDWSKTSDKIHTLTVAQNAEGKWEVKENGVVTDKYLEVNGLTVKVKALGWYRFQFETSTVFGYQLDDSVDTDELNIETGDGYVRYWSDSIRIYRDNVEPNFAWVDNYHKENSYDAEKVEEYNENFSDLLSNYVT